MHLKLKKSKIVDWWVAKKSNKMAFENFLLGEPLEGDLLVVGYYLDKNQKQLASSTNHVVRITKDGVITAQGSFYPFEEAHELYMQFLISANEDNTLIASHWDFVEDSSKIIADITENGIVKEGITFDFTPDKAGVMLSGYSEDLKSRVVLNTFRKRDFCTIIGIPESVKADIYYSSFSSYEESRERLEKVRKIFEDKIKDSYISVKIGLD